MINPEVHKVLSGLTSDDLRQVIAHAAGIHAHRDGDGGTLMATALRRVADRIENRPRRAAG